jgi:hypothetical protein
MVAEVRERLTVIKDRSHRFHKERFSLKLNEVEGKEQYRVEVSNSFAALTWILIVLGGKSRKKEA